MEKTRDALPVIFSVIFSIIIFGSTKPATDSLFEKADHEYVNKNYRESANLYETLTQKNPYRGQFLYRLGYSYYSIGEYNKAIEAYKRAVDVGFLLGSTYYDIASNYALLSSKKDAIHNLILAVKYGFKDYQWMQKDDDLKSLRDELEFQKLLGKPLPSNLTAQEGWLHDVDYFVDRAESLHYNLFGKQTKSEWHKHVQNLRDKLKTGSDPEIIFGMMKLAASIGDGHTYIYPPFKEINPKAEFHSLPLEFYQFSDGLYITSAKENYSQIVGAKVNSVRGVLADELVIRAGNYLGSDNEWSVKNNAELILGIAEFYLVEGLSESVNSIIFDVEQNGIRKSIEVKNDGVLSFHGRFEINKSGWVYLNQDSEKPLYLQKPNDSFWMKYFDDSKILYAQVDQLEGRHGESFQNFCDKLEEKMNGNEISAFVLDIRNNTGGNNENNRFIINAIIRNKKINQHGKFFTIIGRKTFSAAQNLVGDLEFRTNVIFVGEPTGSKPNHVGEKTDITLPYSGLLCSISDRNHQSGASNSRDYRKWVAPHIAAELTSKNFHDNVDPAMDAILKYLHDAE